MCIDGFQVKLVREDDASKWTEVKFVGMSIRATDCDNSTVGEQFIPFAERGWDWMMRDEFRKKRVEHAMQFGWDKSFEFAYAIPKFDAGVIRDRPVFP